MKRMLVVSLTCFELGILLLVLGNTVLFEDGSVQLFNHMGWGVCLLPTWGC